MEQNQCIGRGIGMRGLMIVFLWSGLLLGALLFVVVGSVHPVAAAIGPTHAAASTLAFGASNYRFNEGQGEGQVVLRVEPPSDLPVTVTVSSANIQAEAAQDFEGLRQSLVISANEAAYTLSVTLLDDLVVEGDEQLRLTLSNYQGILPGVITETIVTIEDNDSVALRMKDIVVEEDGGSVTLVISQSGVSTLDSVVDVRTEDGSATAAEDYTAFFTTAVIPAGMLTATVTILLQADEVPESTESFVVRLEEPTNATIADDTAIVTILDDDIFPELGVAPAQALETDGVMRFEVTLSAASAQTVTVEYGTADGSALTPADYLSQTGILTFPPGSLNAAVDVTVVDDLVDEPNENFYLVLANPVQAVLDSDQVEGIILDPVSFDQRLYLPGVAR